MALATAYEMLQTELTTLIMVKDNIDGVSERRTHGDEKMRKTERHLQAFKAKDNLDALEKAMSSAYTMISNSAQRNAGNQRI